MKSLSFSPTFIALLFLFFTRILHAQEVAITIDDQNCGDAVFLVTQSDIITIMLYTS